MGQEMFNILLLVWIVYTMIKDKLLWWFQRHNIEGLLCFYCLSFWTYLIVSRNIFESCQVGYIAYWYITFQDLLIRKIKNNR